MNGDLLNIRLATVSIFIELNELRGNETNKNTVRDK